MALLQLMNNCKIIGHMMYNSIFVLCFADFLKKPNHHGTYAVEAFTVGYQFVDKPPPFMARKISIKLRKDDKINHFRLEMRLFRVCMIIQVH